MLEAATCLAWVLWFYWFCLWAIERRDNRRLHGTIELYKERIRLLNSVSPQDGAKVYFDREGGFRIEELSDGRIYTPYPGRTTENQPSSDGQRSE